MVKVEDLAHTIASVTLEQINDWLSQFGLCVAVVTPYDKHGRVTRGTTFFLTRSECAPPCECAECVPTGDPLDADISEVLHKATTADDKRSWSPPPPWRPADGPLKGSSGQGGDFR